MEGFDTLYKEWLIEISQKGYNETHQYAIKYDRNLLVSIMEAKEKIPEQLYALKIHALMYLHLFVAL